MRALRIDIGQLRPAKRLADGRLVAEGLLTRAGVFTYRNPDGTERRELRPPEEVFRSDALESFAMTPVTNEHPPELITSKNAKRYAVGAVGENVKRDEDHVRAKLTVYDADTIAQMEAGKASLSCGYEVDVDETPGEHPLYGRYDCIQRNVRGNHVAIVEKGRAGDAARVRMDAGVMLDKAAHKDRYDQGVEMTEQEKKALEEQLAIATKRAEDGEKAAKEASARADKAEGERDGLRIRVDAIDSSPTKLAEVTAERDMLKAQLDAETKKRMDAENPERVQSEVIKRVKIELVAREVLGGVKRFDEFSSFPNRQLMAAVLERMPPRFCGGSVDAKDSDEKVAQRFDTAVSFYEAGEQGKKKIRDAIASESRADTQADTRTSRERFVARMRALGTEPLSKREN